MHLGEKIKLTSFLIVLGGGGDSGLVVDDLEEEISSLRGREMQKDVTIKALLGKLQTYEKAIGSIRTMCEVFNHLCHLSHKRSLTIFAVFFYLDYGEISSYSVESHSEVLRECKDMQILVNIEIIILTWYF